MQVWRRFGFLHFPLLRELPDNRLHSLVDIQQIEITLPHGLQLCGIICAASVPILHKRIEPFDPLIPCGIIVCLESNDKAIIENHFKCPIVIELSRCSVILS